MERTIKKLIQYLDSLKGKPSSPSRRAERAIEVAKLLHGAIRHTTTLSEKRREGWLTRLIDDKKGRLFTSLFADFCLRSESNKRSVDMLLYTLKKVGIPRFLQDEQRIKFILFQLLGSSFPDFFLPRIKKQIFKELSPIIFSDFSALCKKGGQEGLFLNVHPLGEMVLGEDEAAHQIHLYLKTLTCPNLEAISLKLSGLFSQIHLVAFEESVEVLVTRLRPILRAALERKILVMLDMENYRERDLTIAVFQKALSEPEFMPLRAGLALQGYLPETFEILKSLGEWAKVRTEGGGAPLYVRLVKGANLSVERFESQLKGWTLPTYAQKAEVDASFKRLLESALNGEFSSSFQLGIATHNLFDVAYALVLLYETETFSRARFELLSGMAEPLMRVLKGLTQNVMLYCPQVEQKHFVGAFAYLMRRLDENCEPGNFLRSQFHLAPHNREWMNQEELFLRGCSLITNLPSHPQKTQDRCQIPSHLNLEEPFKNEADTDLSLPQNRLWANEIYAEWREKKGPTIPLCLSGEFLETTTRPGIDPSSPETPRYHTHLADQPLIQKALSCALDARASWGTLPHEARSHLLGKVAHLMRRGRRNLIGVMIADVAKSFEEADQEVSEAIDFLEYYRKIWQKQVSFPDLKWTAKGPTLIASPWNFPCSIPAGGIAAALIVGNPVLFKPAPEAAWVGWELVQLFWEAGIPKEALQFLCCEEDPVGNALIAHPDLTTVLLTGASATAEHFLKLRPGIDLHAETGGKNGMIVSAMSDRDLAIKDLVASAFHYSGQKCSALSIAILEKEVYEDPSFKRKLIDAAKSLKVGSAWDPSAKITPLIHPPQGALLRALTTLEPGEDWLLEPQPHPENPHLWSPGIKWGVTQGSFTHQTELFGPLLGVMKAESLEHAIELVNSTPYGLTSGLHSLDEREQIFWKERVQAGNLYINRTITGAIVRRQPFGGCKASNFGAGAKAGGPNYVNQLATCIQVGLPHERGPLPTQLVPLLTLSQKFELTSREREFFKRSLESYAYWAPILKEETDPSAIPGQHNLFYHVPRGAISLFLKPDDEALPLLQVIAASLACKVPLEISTSKPLSELQHLKGVQIVVEEEAAFLNRLPNWIRLLSPASPSLKKIGAEKGAYLIEAPVLANGRFELLHYLREVSLSQETQRYGYIP